MKGCVNDRSPMLVSVYMEPNCLRERRIGPGLIITGYESHSMDPRRNSIMGSICVYIVCYLAYYGPTLEPSVVVTK